MEVSRECSQCIIPFLPAEPSSDNLDDVEGLEEERDGETKAIQTATAKKSSSSLTTTKSWKKTSNRKIEEDEGEDETVLKIYDIVLMSAIDAIDIDASQAPRHVSFSPINTSNWMTAYASFTTKAFRVSVQFYSVRSRRRHRWLSLATKRVPSTTKRKRTTTTMSAVKITAELWW